MLWRAHPRLSRTLLGLSLALLWLLSTPIVASRFLDSLAPEPVVLSGREADAIVILGGGRIRNSVEFGGDTINRFSQERLRYGAQLARTLGKPVLVSGGSPEGESLPEAGIMAAVLRDEYRVPVRWQEDRSRTTRENALFSAEILHKAGIQRVYLVTHAWHLARAMPEFERVGIKVIPAGTGYRLEGESQLFDFIPHPQALLQSHLACHEWLGRLWYRLQY